MNVRKRYTEAVYRALSENPSWRLGQTAFNVAYEMFPDIANKYRGTEDDPFYVDEKTEGFIEKVIGDAEAK